MQGFWELIQQAAHNPALLITILLTLGVVLVNGWTDAPNAAFTTGVDRAFVLARLKAAYARLS